MPNYLVTEDCGKDRCYRASPEARMASVAWHGERVTRRSCGDVAKRIGQRPDRKHGCLSLWPLAVTWSSAAPVGLDGEPLDDELRDDEPWADEL